MAAAFPTFPGFAEVTRLFAQMKVPMSLDMDAFVALSRRNMETLAAANRVALDGAQALARRHMEIMQQNMSEMAEVLREATTAEDPRAKAARQAELLKKSYEHAVANIQEMGAMIQKSNDEAIALLQTRFNEAMQEIKALTGQS